MTITAAQSPDEGDKGAKARAATPMPWKIVHLPSFPPIPRPSSPFPFLESKIISIFSFFL